MSENGKRKKQKKIILINREIQLKYAWAAVVIGLISTLLTATIILYPLYQFKILRAVNFLPTPFLLSMGGAIILNVVALAILAIYVTHKIVGPMFSLVRQFRLIELGHWNSKLNVRSDDELKFVVRNFNAAVDSMVQATNQDLEILNSLKSKVEECNDQSLKSDLSKYLQTFSDRFQARLQEDHREKKYREGFD